MLDKKNIIELISKDREYHRMALNIAKEYNLSKDLFQELILVLFDYKDEVILDLHEKKQLKFFCSRIMSNMFTNPKSNFSKTYLTHSVEVREYKQGSAEPQTNIPKELTELMQTPLEKLIGQVDDEFILLRLSVDRNSVTDLANEMGIERAAIQMAIARATNKLKLKYGKV